MGYHFEETHERILNSAMRHFMEVGFREASIRNICREAGVTNGAFYAHFKSKEDLFCQLVDPALQGLSEVYRDENRRYESIRSAEDILAAFENTFSSDQILVHYIYSHRDAFLLLLNAGSGTEYEDFPAMLTAQEEKETEAFLRACRPYVRRSDSVTSNIISKISSLVVSTIFDCFRMGMTEEETVRETQLASEFCLAGLKALWEI